MNKGKLPFQQVSRVREKLDYDVSYLQDFLLCYLDADMFPCTIEVIYFDNLHDLLDRYNFASSVE